MWNLIFYALMLYLVYTVVMMYKEKLIYWPGAKGECKYLMWHYAMHPVPDDFEPSSGFPPFQGKYDKYLPAPFISQEEWELVVRPYSERRLAELGIKEWITHER